VKKSISVFILLLSLILTSCSKERINQLNNLSSSSNAPDAKFEPATNNKESWSEWTSRQWNENRTRWIGSIVGVSLVAVGCYIVYDKCFKNRQSAETNPPGTETNPPGTETNPPGTETNP